MKKYNLIAILLIAVMMFVGCSHNAEVSKNADESESVSFSASKTENHDSKIVTETESSTEISTTEAVSVEKTSRKETTTKPAEQKSAGQTTTKSTTKSAAKKQTAAKAQTTTKKQTTKKVTTTEEEWDCNVDGHSCKEGPIGWCNSYDEAAKKARNYIDQNADSGGYRIEHCYWCGKYTAAITLD